ncbi:hypothetical protein SDC9_58731 [bioreactor metagenome]|uniref:Uncharacterized protein n=1 Tax=bioreactor metagenome TaxID=1076179 RepID=A0A644X947_9ZZZZ
MGYFRAGPHITLLNGVAKGLQVLRHSLQKQLQEHFPLVPVPQKPGEETDPVEGGVFCLRRFLSGEKR